MWQLNCSTVFSCHPLSVLFFIWIKGCGKFHELILHWIQWLHWEFLKMTTLCCNSIPPTNLDRCSVWFLNPGIILQIWPKSYFHERHSMSAQRNFDAPAKNWGIFRVVPPRGGWTQHYIYDLFLLEVLWFVRLLYDREWNTKVFVDCDWAHTHKNTPTMGNVLPSMAVHRRLRCDSRACHIVADVWFAFFIFFFYDG